MYKLLVTCAFTLILTLMSNPVFPLSYQLDFNGDEIGDAEHTLTPGDKVTLDVWLEGYSCPLDDKIYGVSLYFQYDYTKIQVNEENSYRYDSDNGGPWNPDFSYFYNWDDGVYELGVGDSDPLVVNNNKIKLGVIELECIGAGDASIKAATDLGFGGYSDGVVIDCDIESQHPVDANATVHQMTTSIPTLSEWGIIIFMMVIMGIGVMVIRKRRVI